MNRPACPVCEDVAWMRDTGESPYQWPIRVGWTAAALEQHLRRHGAAHLAAALQPIITKARRRAA